MIYPGLIKLHDHPTYNILPLWQVPKLYRNRNTWIKKEPEYLPDISWPMLVLAGNKDKRYSKAVARYVECRSLCGGATTFQGVSRDGEYYRGLARNAEVSRDPELPNAAGRVQDLAAAEVATILAPALTIDRTYFYHLSEGTDPDARQKFLELKYAAGQWAINQNLAAIHCVGLQEEDFARLVTSAGVIWSPLSNYMLYGRTMDFAAAKAAGVRVCLGADWGPSGSKNLLGELKIARIANILSKGGFSASDLVAMVTINAAEALGWSKRIGSIEPDKYADLLILSDTTGDPYDQLTNANETDIAAVLVGGQPRLGRENLLEFNAVSQENLTIGGNRYIIVLANDDGTPLGAPKLSNASDLLTDALARLPKIARDYQSFFAEVAAQPEKYPQFVALAALGDWGLDLEFEPEERSVYDYALAASEVDPNLIHPMKLAPLSLVDETDFMPTVKANINLPPAVRTKL